MFGSLVWSQRLGGVRWASKAAASSTKNGRDSCGKRLGIKVWQGGEVSVGQIIVRQRGTKWLAGEGVKLCRDWTIVAAVEGRVEFTRTRTYKTRRKTRSVVNVFPKSSPSIADWLVY